MRPTEIPAIDPVRTDTWRSIHWLFRHARWQLTCGGCHTRFDVSHSFRSSRTTCPSCGTINVLWLQQPPKRGAGTRVRAR